MTALAIWCIINEKGGDDTNGSVEYTDLDLWDLNVSEQILV